METTSDIVIIGGGIYGTSIALNLRRDGYRGRVVVIERDPSYRFASTSLAMGGVRQQYMSRVNIELVQYSVKIFENTPEAEFRQRGYLFLGDDANWPQLERRFEVERSLGAEVEKLTVHEVRSMVPDLWLDDCVGAVFGPRDGYVMPRRVLEYFRSQAAMSGIEYMNGEVTGIHHTNGCIDALDVEGLGRIGTNVLVIAAGAYSAQVAELAGVRIPVYPTRQHLFRCRLPRPWSYEFPMVIDPGGVHWRSYPENQIVIAKTRTDEPPGINFDVDEQRYATDFQPDLARRVPEFSELEYVTGWTGLYENTPDHNGLVGSWPGLEGLYFACGFSGHGLMMSPAVGKVMSEIIRTGRAETVDVSMLAPDRFDRGALFIDEAMI